MGAEFDATDKDGQTALMKAASRGKVECVRILATQVRQNMTQFRVPFLYHPVSSNAKSPNDNASARRVISKPLLTKRAAQHATMQRPEGNIK